MIAPAPALDTRQKIVLAARAVFSENGFGGASTRAIASKAGVNEATIFRLFGDKRGLFELVLEDVVAQRGIDSLLLGVHQQTGDPLTLLCKMLVGAMQRSRDAGDYKLLLHVGLDHPELLKTYAAKIRQPLFATLGKLLATHPQREAISRLIVGTLWYEVVILPLLDLEQQAVPCEQYAELFSRLLGNQSQNLAV